MAKIEEKSNYYQKPVDFLGSKNYSIWYYFWKILNTIKSWFKNAN